MRRRFVSSMARMAASLPPSTRLATACCSGRSQPHRRCYAALLINALTVDPQAAAETVLDILTSIASDVAVHDAVAAAMAECALAALRRCPEGSATHDRLAHLLGT